MKKNIYLLFLLSFLFALKVQAQLINDFRVNDDMTNFRKLHSSIDLDSQGNFIFVWEDYRHNRPNVYCQRYDKSAGPLLSNFRINVINDTAFLPFLAVSSNGNFAVCWNENNNLIPQFKIRFYNYEGTAITNTLIYNDSIAKIYREAKIVATNSGKFIATWKNRSTLNGIDKIYFQRFDAFGNRIGNNVRVDDSNFQKDYSSISVLPDDRFVITWEDKRPPAQLNEDIYMQILDSSGNKIGNNTRVSDDTSFINYQNFPIVSSDSSGNFCIAFSNIFVKESDSDVILQRYDKNGNRIGNNITIAGTGFSEYARALSVRDNGDMVVGYEVSSSFVTSVFQRVRADGSLIGGPYLVSTQVPGIDKLYDDVALYNDRIISVWSDKRSGNFEIYSNIRSFSNPDSTVAVIQISNEIPEGFKLYQNYPNPFNPFSRIDYELPITNYVSLRVYDITGKVISTLVEQTQHAGTYSVTIDGNALPSGVYFYRLEAKNFKQIKKMVVLK